VKERECSLKDEAEAGRQFKSFRSAPERAGAGCAKGRAMPTEAKLCSGSLDEAALAGPCKSICNGSFLGAFCKPTHCLQTARVEHELIKGMHSTALSSHRSTCLHLLQQTWNGGDFENN